MICHPLTRNGSCGRGLICVCEFCSFSFVFVLLLPSTQSCDCFFSYCSRTYEGWVCCKKLLEFICPSRILGACVPCCHPPLLRHLLNCCWLRMGCPACQPSHDNCPCLTNSSAPHTLLLPLSLSPTLLQSQSLPFVEKQYLHPSAQCQSSHHPCYDLESGRVSSLHQLRVRVLHSKGNKVTSSQQSLHHHSLEGAGANDDPPSAASCDCCRADPDPGVLLLLCCT